METFKCGSVAHWPEGAIPVRGRRLGPSGGGDIHGQSSGSSNVFIAAPPMFLCGDEVSTSTHPRLSLMLSLPD